MYVYKSKYCSVSGKFTVVDKIEKEKFHLKDKLDAVSSMGEIVVENNFFYFSVPKLGHSIKDEMIKAIDQFNLIEDRNKNIDNILKNDR